MRIEERNAQVLAVTEQERDEVDSNNPIIFAETGPNRFALMSLFFSDINGKSDGVTITEDLELNEITVEYFDEENDSKVELTEGPVYDWAVEFYKENY